MAQTPDHIYFAGMRLNLSDGLRSQIDQQIAIITKNKNFFQAKVDRADTYFPIIERSFKEENVPIDFKYLVIQESGLQSDVVSTSNAVGFWQFKAESAREVGMIIDHKMDDRKHITKSSVGAARYIKKNYLLLSNWLYALIAYNTGYGGVRKLVDNKYIGATEMDLDESLHWYAIKFLAFKLAYEDKVGYNKVPNLQLLEYYAKDKTLAQVASDLNLDELKLKDYNKWLQHYKIPDDKDYIIILPVSPLERDNLAAKLNISVEKIVVDDISVDNDPIPDVAANVSVVQNKMLIIFINNGLRAIKAGAGDNVAKIAYEAGITKKKFLRYNDMEKFEEVQIGQIYYLESKNSKALVLFHIVKKGETSWSISQKYGIREYKLRRLNRIKIEEGLAERRLLYLRNDRPNNEPIIIAEPEKIVVKNIPENTIRNNPKIVLDSINQNKNQTVKNTPDKTIKSNPKIVLDSSNQFKIQTVKIAPKITLDTNNQFKSNDFKIIKDNFKIDSSAKYHLVQLGQTLYSISRYYSCSIDSIVKWNQLQSQSIKFAQLIIVSKNPKIISKSFWTYTVNENITWDIVSEDTKKEKDQILIWNQKNKSDLFAGEQLKIKR